LTLAGGVVFVVLLSPAFPGSLVAGSGAVIPDVPCGEFGDGGVSVVPLVVPADEGAGAVSVVAGVDEDGPAIDEPPVVDVLDELDIELSVFGCSGLLQAPSTATAATMAASLIEPFMNAPRSLW
jgi:hypothetical protein